MFSRFEPRPLAFLGVESVVGYRLKIYAITYGNESFDRNRFVDAWLLASDELPHPAVTDQRPGFGFVILHQGKTGDYFILCWWDRENELPTRVFIRDSKGWRKSIGGESFCVWDLKVMWFEREAYVGKVLMGDGGGPEAYFAEIIEGSA
jgi:hypothetical protein